LRPERGARQDEEVVKALPAGHRRPFRKHFGVHEEPVGLRARAEVAVTGAGAVRQKGRRLHDLGSML
jgi:hypothetical protein